MGSRAPLGNMIIELGLDSTKMSDGLVRARNQLKNFEKQIRAQKGLADFYKTGANAAKAYEAQKKTLNQAIETQTQLLSNLKKKYDIEVEKEGALSEKAQKLAGQIEVANGKLVGFVGQLKDVSKEAYLASSKLNAFGDKLVGFSKGAEKWENGLNTVSQRTQGLSLAIFGGMTLSAKAAMDFETAFTGVKKTVDEVVDKNGQVTYSYEMLSNGIRQMAKEIPATTTEISAVAEAAGQLGIKTENVLDFTKVMIDLGESTNLSATEAATALARFQNITQMSQSDFGKLGSVIVDLGNNMATTEQEITDMGLRLASTGKLVGLTEPQIMALAATLSAVGMEAEAGGSAMSRVMQKMNTAVAKGKEALDKFATVAGLSAEEFAAKWKAEPQTALIDFLNGLRRIKAAGGDVTQTLKSMKISNVRDIDSLQRLAGAGDLLKEAIDRASVAWDQNIALTNEATKRYGTAESKLKVARNKINDLAITLGEPLLDAFIDVIDASEPLIKDLAGMAKAFSELDKESQQSIIRMALMVGAISPVSKIFGSTIGTVGDLAGGIGKLSKKIADFGAKKAGEKAIKGLATAASGATGQVSGLAGAVGVLGSPVLWTAIGGVALVALTYFTGELAKAEYRTRLWGTEVDKVQAEQLQAFKDKVDESTEAMTLFGVSGKGDVEGVKQAFKELVDEITKLTDEQLTKDLDMAQKLGLSDQVQEALKRNAEAVKTYAQRMSDDVIAIYQRHANDHTQLTEEEKQIVLEKQTELINTQLELMEFSKEERVAIQKAMNGEIDELNKSQVKQAVELTSKWMDDEKTAYEKRKDELINLRKQITGSTPEDIAAREEINKQLLNLESDHLATMAAYREKHIIALRSLYDKEKEAMAGNEQGLSALEQSYKNLLGGMGVSWEEFIGTSTAGSQKLVGDYQYLGQTIKGMSDEAVEANQRWKGLIWDEKNAKLKTNATEELQNALQVEGGWNNLQFILKHATLDSNARQMLVEAMVQAGQWNQFSINEKNLLVDGNQAMIDIATSQELLKQWNALTPEQKKLLAENLVAAPSMEAQAHIDSVRQNQAIRINAENQTIGPAKAASQTVNAVKQNQAIAIKAVNNTGGEASQASATVNSVRQLTPAYIRAINETSEKAQAARRDLLSIPPNITSTITTFVQKIFSNEHGTDFHPGGLAMVNDQKGPLYKELVTLPTGEQFIPEGRDVILPLPRGSKVLPARQTRDLMRSLHIPNYAKGVGYSENSPLIRGIDRAQSRLDSRINIQQPSNARLEKLLERLLLVMESQGNENTTYHFDLELGGIAFKSLIDKITLEQQRNEKIRLRMT